MLQAPFFPEEVEQCNYITNLINTLANKDIGQRDDVKGGKRDIHFININYSVHNNHAVKALVDKKSVRWDDVRFHRPVKKFLGRRIGSYKDIRLH